MPPQPLAPHAGNTPGSRGTKRWLRIVLVIPVIFVLIAYFEPNRIVRGWIGVSIQELTADLAKQFGAADAKGALIGDVIEDSPASKAKLIVMPVEEFREKFTNPYIAASRGFLDEVIQPRETRRKLITALRSLDNKRDRNPPKKHGNIPL